MHEYRRRIDLATKNETIAGVEVKTFRPDDIERIIETASGVGHPTLDDIRLMAVEELARLASLPPGPGRDAEMVETRKTIADVLREKLRRLRLGKILRRMRLRRQA